jgi:DNA-binding transcriptional MerR regulator
LELEFRVQSIVLGQLPDEILKWRGTAAALADQCNALLPGIGLGEDAGAANERLVRHYVQVGVLTPPERDGREALFDERHIREFLTARYLLKDGWSLAKITELMRAAGPEGLTTLIPKQRVPTAAEQALARLKSGASETSRTRVAPRATSARSAPVADAAMKTLSSAASIPVPLPDPLRQAAEISQRRMDLKSNLSGLGNASGQPVRRRTVHIALTPWCQVYVDAAELAGLPANTPELLGKALTQALHEERIQRGEKS